MKKYLPSLITSIVMLAFTGVALAKDEIKPVTPQPKPQAKPQIEVCFVLDTTSSMSGLIEGAKQKIWSIANEMIATKPTPDIRIGLVGFRDRGDEYVTRHYDLTNDIDAVYANLTKFSAAGGGDTPESVNEALNVAALKMSWSADKRVLKIIFLVGDAPPHMDYSNDVKYPDVCQAAMKRDLIINTVQCGGITETAPIWQEIAKLGEGNYAAIAQSGGMAVIATPMDADIASLNLKLGGTMIGYGDTATRRFVAEKQSYSEVAPASVAADRLSFNAASGVVVQGGGELLDELAAGNVKLDGLKKESLPEDMRKLSETDLKTAINKKQEDRAEIQKQIAKLAKDRNDYITAERSKTTTGKDDSFDEKVAGWIQSQATRKGIQYGK